MNEHFKIFLQENGLYALFSIALKNRNRKSFNQHCKQNKTREYCYGLSEMSVITQSEERELTKKWLDRYVEIKKETLYKFLVDQGVLFQFISILKKGKTIDSICKNENIIYRMINQNIIKDAYESDQWLEINKRWEIHIYETLFNF